SRAGSRPSCSPRAASRPRPVSSWRSGPRASPPGASFPPFERREARAPLEPSPPRSAGRVLRRHRLSLTVPATLRLVTPFLVRGLLLRPLPDAPPPPAPPPGLAVRRGRGTHVAGAASRRPPRVRVCRPQRALRARAPPPRVPPLDSEPRPRRALL